MTEWWMESGRGPRVGWRETADDPVVAAGAAASRLGRDVTIHAGDCNLGKVGGEGCSCNPRVVQPPARA